MMIMPAIGVWPTTEACIPFLLKQDNMCKCKHASTIKGTAYSILDNSSSD